MFSLYSSSLRFNSINSKQSLTGLYDDQNNNQGDDQKFY